MTLTNLMQAEDYQKIAQIDELIKKDPYNPVLLMQKGHIFYSKMADDLAAEAFKQAIKIDHTYVDAYFWLAECLNFHLGESDEAEKIVLQGLQLDSNREDLVKLLAAIREDKEGGIWL